MLVEKSMVRITLSIVVLLHGLVKTDFFLACIPTSLVFGVCIMAECPYRFLPLDLHARTYSLHQIDGVVSPDLL
jgi:hypothetical protein